MSLFKDENLAYSYSHLEGSLFICTCPKGTDADVVSMSLPAFETHLLTDIACL